MIAIFERPSRNVPRLIQQHQWRYYHFLAPGWLWSEPYLASYVATILHRHLLIFILITDNGSHILKSHKPPMKPIKHHHKRLFNLALTLSRLSLHNNHLHSAEMVTLFPLIHFLLTPLPVFRQSTTQPSPPPPGGPTTTASALSASQPYAQP